MRFLATYLLMLSMLAGVVCAEMSQQAYVWQRSWTPRLLHAIEQESQHVDGLTVLCAEVMRDAHGEPTWINVSVDYAALKKSATPLTLAIRVSDYPGPFDAAAPITQCLLTEVDKALAAARAAGVQLTALEIDFDCATRNLEGYAQWLQLIRERLDGVPLSITTLPTWMTRPDAFRDLVAATDHFVLQVHSIQRADRIDSNVMLCDPARAEKWTRQAAQFGKPYHVALPTYAYRLSYDATGELVEVAAENASPLQNPDWRYRVIRAEPEAMSALVRSFERTRPENCLGVIWYRLPIGQELHNWDAQTWHAVMAGRVGGDRWQVQARATAEGLVEIELLQLSEIAVEPPRQVIVSWGEGTALAWDGQRNYAVHTGPDHGLVWEWPQNMSPPLLPQGTRWTIGWLRMEAPTELKLSLINDVD